MAEQTPMVKKLQARHAQLVTEHQANKQRIEATRQQLTKLEEAEIGYLYVIGEIERLITAEQEQNAAEQAAEQTAEAAAQLEQFVVDTQAATESDTEKAAPRKRSRASATRGGSRRAR